MEIFFEDPKIKLPTTLSAFRMHLKTSPKLANVLHFATTPTPLGQLYHALGVTSIESYVTWETVEGKKEGEWDWSRWDEQVRVLKEHDLKWVPFLILGPAYSTPDWFRESSEHYGCRCLEHGTPSKVESLWNPNSRSGSIALLRRSRAIRQERRESESVLLESRATSARRSTRYGAALDVRHSRRYHNHAGSGATDPYALRARKFVVRKIQECTESHKAWGSSYAAAARLTSPPRGTKEFRGAWRGDPLAAGAALEVDWLPRVHDRLVGTGGWRNRKHFPKTPIYLCTGGDAIPEHGSNFAEQVHGWGRARGGCANYERGVRLRG